VAKREAFAMGHHERLGARSIIHTLDADVMNMILALRPCVSMGTSWYTFACPIEDNPLASYCLLLQWPVRSDLGFDA